MDHKINQLPQGDCYLDLHLHIDGAITPKIAIALAKIEGVSLPTTDEDELVKYLEAPKDGKNLVDYLKAFDLPVSLMQSQEAIKEAVYLVQEKLKSQGIIYAELRFAPQLHTKHGLTQKEVVEAAIEGLHRSNLKSNLILCCMRFENNKTENLETEKIAKEFLNCGVVAMDLAGPEADNPVENYTEIFEQAKKDGIPFTIHAGEARGAESVKKAVELGASRIGHGVRSVEDISVVKLLAQRKIPLELCPTSNLDTKVFDALSEYPIEQLIADGVIVTINSDNPVVSATNQKNEIKKIRNQFHFNTSQMKDLLLNGAEVSFADDKTKEFIRTEISKVYA
ncbi:MAG: adenosine deaminase [Anaerostipes sp.]|nr:adenosine deaminase [Anaerostipes sp.]